MVGGYDLGGAYDFVNAFFKLKKKPTCLLKTCRADVAHVCWIN